jgi:outer membrane protein OmpA-like peptidoglycan-associated protein
MAAFAAAALFASAAAGSAQDLSDAELTERFRAQIAAVRAAREDPVLGAARGFSEIVVAPAGEAPGVVLEGGDGLAPLGSQAAAGQAGAEATHWNFRKDAQVIVPITFGFDSAAIEDSQKTKLRQICGVLDDAGVGTLRIVGHTDTSGPTAYNQQLSVLRAEEVQRFFVADCGVAADRLQAIGVGEMFPFDAVNPTAGINRRVEFQALG